MLFCSKLFPLLCLFSFNSFWGQIKNFFLTHQSWRGCQQWSFQFQRRSADKTTCTRTIRRRRGHCKRALNRSRNSSGRCNHQKSPHPCLPTKNQMYTVEFFFFRETNVTARGILWLSTDVPHNGHLLIWEIFVYQRSKRGRSFVVK